MEHDWSKDFKDEQYYIRVFDKEIVYGNVFEGGKPILEWKCSLAEFLRGDHEVCIRIRDIFGAFIYDEVRLVARNKQNE